MFKFIKRIYEEKKNYCMNMFVNVPIMPLKDVELIPDYVGYYIKCLNNNTPYRHGKIYQGLDLGINELERIIVDTTLGAWSHFHKGNTSIATVDKICRDVLYTMLITQFLPKEKVEEIRLIVLDGSLYKILHNKYEERDINYILHASFAGQSFLSSFEVPTY